MPEFIPHTLPAIDNLIVFGVLLVFGTLGGLLAKRLRWLPTITGFMALGLSIGPSGMHLLSREALEGARILVDLALGLILFKLGASLHPVAAARNRALVLTSLVESLATFAVMLGAMLAVGVRPVVAAIAAAIAVSSSPAVLIHVAQELHARGPTVDLAKTLVALNNVIAFLLFSLVLPMALRDMQSSWLVTLGLPAYQLGGAVVVGLVVAFVVTRIGLLTRKDDAHYRFALIVGAVMLALGLARAGQVSLAFTALTLGIASRWLQTRARLAQVEFGSGADLFFIILFVFAGANLHVRELVEFAPVALVYVIARALTKVVAVHACGRRFGQPWRQSAATGLLLVPMAGLAIGLVGSTGALVPELGAQVAAVVLAAVAVFETVGPPIAAFALRLCGEAQPASESPENDDEDAAASTRAT